MTKLTNIVCPDTLKVMDIQKFTPKPSYFDGDSWRLIGSEEHIKCQEVVNPNHLPAPKGFYSTHLLEYLVRYQARQRHLDYDTLNGLLISIGELAQFQQQLGIYWRQNLDISVPVLSEINAKDMLTIEQQIMPEHTRHFIENNNAQQLIQTYRSFCACMLWSPNIVQRISAIPGLSLQSPIAYNSLNPSQVITLQECTQILWPPYPAQADLDLSYANLSRHHELLKADPECFTNNSLCAKLDSTEFVQKNLYSALGQLSEALSQQTIPQSIQACPVSYVAMPEVFQSWSGLISTMFSVNFPGLPSFTNEEDIHLTGKNVTHEELRNMFPNDFFILKFHYNRPVAIVTINSSFENKFELDLHSLSSIVFEKKLLQSSLPSIIPTNIDSINKTLPLIKKAEHKI